MKPQAQFSVAEGIGLGLLWFFSLLFVVGAIINSMSKFDAGVTGESGHVPGTLPYWVLLTQAAIFALPVIFAALLSIFPALRTPVRGYGALLPIPPRLPRFITGIGLTWLIMGVAGVASWVVRFFRGTPTAGVSQTADPSAAEMSVLAVMAGLWEEATYVALPVGFIYLTGTLINAALKYRDRAPLITASRLWVLAAVVGVLWSTGHRSVGHLYQGYEAAVSGLVWGAGLALVFLWARSIWPIMIGHMLYNLPRDHESWLSLTLHQLVVPASLAILGVLLTLVVAHWSSRKGVQFADEPTYRS